MSLGAPIVRKVGEAIVVAWGLKQAGTAQSGKAGTTTVTVYDEAGASFSTPSVSEIGSTGQYEATFTPDAAGKWRAKVVETSLPDVQFFAYDVAATVLSDDTDDIQARLPAALVSGRMDSSVGAMASGVVTATAVATDAIDADALASDAVTEIQSGLATASALSSVAADVTTLLGRITATLFSGITSLAQWLGLLGGKQVGDTTARTELRATGAGSGTYDETTDSQEALRDRGDAAWATADVQAGLTAQGYTTTRAPKLDNLDNLDAAISAVVTAIAALNDLSVADVQSALTAQGYTSVRAALLDNLDATISSVASAIAGLNDLSSADVAAAVAADPKLVLVSKILRNRTDYNPATGVFTVYDDDSTTPLVSGTGYLDVAGTQPYDGSAATHRRNRLT